MITNLIPTRVLVNKDETACRVLFRLTGVPKAWIAVKTLRDRKERGGLHSFKFFLSDDVAANDVVQWWNTKTEVTGELHRALAIEKAEMMLHALAPYIKHLNASIYAPMS